MTYVIINDDGVQGLDYNNLVYRLTGKAVISGCEPTASASTLGVDISAGQIFFQGNVVDVPAQTVTVDPGEADGHRRDGIAVDQNGDGAVRKGNPAEYVPDITDGSGNPDLDRLFETHSPRVPAQSGNVPIADVAVPEGTGDFDDRYIRDRRFNDTPELYELLLNELQVSDTATIPELSGHTSLEEASVTGAMADYDIHRHLAHIDETTASYVILLEEFDSTVDDWTRGRVTGKRDSGSTGVTDTVDLVTTSTNGGAHRGSAIVNRATDWSNSFIDLVTCTYDGIEYVALRYDTDDQNITHDDVYFRGESSSTAPEHLTVVVYRDVNGVQNAEINGSLTPLRDRSAAETRDFIDFRTSSLRHNGEEVGTGSGSGGTGGLTYTEGEMTLPSGDHRELGTPLAVPVGATFDVYTVAVDGGSNLELQVYNESTSSVEVTYTSSYLTGDPIDSLAVGGDTVVPRLVYNGSGMVTGASGMIQFDVIE